MPHTSLEAKKERMLSRVRHRPPSRRISTLALRRIRSHGKPPPDVDFVTDSLAVGGKVLICCQRGSEASPLRGRVAVLREFAHRQAGARTPT